MIFTFSRGSNNNTATRDKNFHYAVEIVRKEFPCNENGGLATRRDEKNRTNKERGEHVYEGRKRRKLLDFY